MRNGIIAFLSLISAVAPLSARAHCPLCTAGAVAAGGVAAWLGVSSTSIGVFLGAAALSMGWWFARKVRRRFFPLQTQIIAVLVFLSTIIPLVPFFPGETSWYLAFGGAYGTLLHNVYLVNLFLLGSAIGAIAVLAAPTVSKRVASFRGGKAVPYQGLAITFLLLLGIALIIEFAR